jgi:hypothetical protein
MSDVTKRWIEWMIKEYNRLSIENLIKRDELKPKEIKEKTLKNESDDHILDKEN